MAGMGKTMRKVLTRKVQFEFLASEAQDVYKERNPKGRCV